MAVCLTAIAMCVGLGPLNVASADDSPPAFTDADCNADDQGVMEAPGPEGNVTFAVVAACSPVQPDVSAEPDGANLPETGSSTGGLMIGSAMVLAGVAASLVSRKRI